MFDALGLPPSVKAHRSEAFVFMWRPRQAIVAAKVLTETYFNLVFVCRPTLSDRRSRGPLATLRLTFMYISHSRDSLSILNKLRRDREDKWKRRISFRNGETVRPVEFILRDRLRPNTRTDSEE